MSLWPPIDVAAPWTAETPAAPAPPDDVDVPAPRLTVTCEYVPWPARTPPYWSGRPPTNLAAELAAIHEAHVAAYGPGGWTGGANLPVADEDRDEAVWVAPEPVEVFTVEADGAEWVAQRMAGS